MFKFLRSRHKNLYIRLGFKYNVWPERVYKLAHGKKHAKRSKDTKIMHELLSEGIVHRRSDQYSSSDDKVIFEK